MILLTSHLINYPDSAALIGQQVDEFREDLMLLGYACVSTRIRAAGCDRIFVDTGSGGLVDRVELAKLMEAARQDDVIVCGQIASGVRCGTRLRWPNNFRSAR